VGLNIGADGRNGRLALPAVMFAMRSDDLLRRRKALGLTQAQVAERMSVTKSRVSQIERGDVSTIEAVARYVQAIGGHIQISAVFGDDHYILRGTVTEAA